MIFLSKMTFYEDILLGRLAFFSIENEKQFCHRKGSDWIFVIIYFIPQREEKTK